MADGAKIVGKSGDPIKVTLAGTVTHGDVIALADQIAIAVTDGVSGDIIAAETAVKVVLPKEAALAIAQGDNVYWDDTAKEIDKTTTNVKAGKCSKAAAAGDSTVEVDIGRDPGPAA